MSEPVEDAALESYRQQRLADIQAGRYKIHPIPPLKPDANEGERLLHRLLVAANDILSMAYPGAT